MKGINWIAGFLEGEGCFSIINANNTLGVRATSTDYDVLSYLQRAVPGSLIYGPRQSSQKPYWVWSVTSGPADSLIHALYPLMGERRRKQMQYALKKSEGSSLCKKCYERPKEPGRSPYCSICKARES